MKPKLVSILIRPARVVRRWISIATILVGWFIVPTLSSNAQMIIAHRGASQEAPENTLAAFELAFKQGADGIEGDFWLTKDEQVVCLHDADTERTAGVKLVPSQSTLAELQELDVGAWKSDRYSGERIPTLDQVLLTVPPGKKIFVEVKCGPEILPFLLRSIEQSKVTWDQVSIISFDKTVIAGAAKMLPRANRYWLTGFEHSADKASWSPGFDQIADTLSEAMATGLDCKADRQVVTSEFIAKLKERDWEFHCWTVDDVEQAKHFRDLGAQSITTNRPDVLIRQLRARN